MFELEENYVCSRTKAVHNKTNEQMRFKKMRYVVGFLKLVL